MKSTIEMMVDKACGYIEGEPTLEEKAKLIAREVIGHIDLMYPEMWLGVTKNARTSLIGMIINQVYFNFEEKESPPNIQSVPLRKNE